MGFESAAIIHTIKPKASNEDNRMAVFDSILKNYPMKRIAVMYGYMDIRKNFMGEIKKRRSDEHHTYVESESSFVIWTEHSQLHNIYKVKSKKRYYVLR